MRIFMSSVGGNGLDISSREKQPGHFLQSDLLFYLFSSLSSHHILQIHWDWIGRSFYFHPDWFRIWESWFSDILSQPNLHLNLPNFFEHNYLTLLLSFDTFIWGFSCRNKGYYRMYLPDTWISNSIYMLIKIPKYTI